MSRYKILAVITIDYVETEKDALIVLENMINEQEWKDCGLDISIKTIDKQ